MKIEQIERERFYIRRLAGFLISSLRKETIDEQELLAIVRSFVNRKRNLQKL